jgi:hypothetical protein
VNWNGCKRKRSWFILKYYTSTFLKALRKTIKPSSSIADPRVYIENCGLPIAKQGYKCLNWMVKVKGKVIPVFEKWRYSFTHS